MLHHIIFSLERKRIILKRPMSLSRQMKKKLPLKMRNTKLDLSLDKLVPYENYIYGRISFLNPNFKQH